MADSVDYVKRLHQLIDGTRRVLDHREVLWRLARSAMAALERIAYEERVPSAVRVGPREIARQALLECESRLSEIAALDPDAPKGDA